MTESRRLDRIRDPQYLSNLDARALDDLRSMRAECVEIETEASYCRRLTQARVDILEAEQARRSLGEGGSLDALILDLPRILAGDSQRSTVSQSRVPQLLAPSGIDDLKAEFGTLLEDTTLANLPVLNDAELYGALESFRELENQISILRKELHHVIDTIDTHLTKRFQVEGP